MRRMMTGYMGAAAALGILAASVEPPHGYVRRTKPAEGEPDTAKDAPEGSRQRKRWLQRQARKAARRHK